MKNIKNLSDINIRSSLNLKNPFENDTNKIVKENSLNYNSDKNKKPNINLSPRSDQNKIVEAENIEYKKSNSYNLGEGVTLFKINNFNDNQNNQNNVKKSKTYKEKNINRLNLTYKVNNIGHRRLDTVLETINEVSNSNLHSSYLSNQKDIKENNNANKDKNNIKKEIHNENEKVNDTEHNTINKCDIKCKTCTLESVNNNLCTSCNNDKVYFQKEDDTLNNNII